MHQLAPLAHLLHPTPMHLGLAIQEPHDPASMLQIVTNMPISAATVRTGSLFINYLLELTADYTGSSRAIHVDFTEGYPGMLQLSANGESTFTADQFNTSFANAKRILGAIKARTPEQLTPSEKAMLAAEQAYHTHRQELYTPAGFPSLVFWYEDDHASDRAEETQTMPVRPAPGGWAAQEQASPDAIARLRYRPPPPRGIV